MDSTSAYITGERWWVEAPVAIHARLALTEKLEEMKSTRWEAKRVWRSLEGGALGGAWVPNLTQQRNAEISAMSFDEAKRMWLEAYDLPRPCESIIRYDFSAEDFDPVCGTMEPIIGSDIPITSLRVL